MDVAGWYIVGMDEDGVVNTLGMYETEESAHIASKEVSAMMWSHVQVVFAISAQVARESREEEPPPQEEEPPPQEEEPPPHRRIRR